MADVEGSGPAGERDRIVAEYARRRRDLPDRYSWADPANQFLHTGLWRECIGALRRENMFPLAGRRVLDVGCGGGSWLLEFVQWGADPACLAGIDLVEDRIAHAKRNLPLADIVLGDASAMPWEAGRFDLVTQFTVFSSILDPGMRGRVAAEMLRVTKPGGLILWFDCAYDNPWNKSVIGIKLDEIRRLFPGCRTDSRRSRLTPQLARLLAPVSWPLAELAQKIPFLRSHYLVAIHKE